MLLIRHGQTDGNALGRYIGITDESLSKSGRQELEGLQYGKVERVFASPLKRTVQTAEILFSDCRAAGEETIMELVPELAECDFGEFENRNYIELDGNEHYQQWIDSGGTLPFPGGESREAFRERNLRGFEKVVLECTELGIKRAALVIHGGTIMNLMEAYAEEKKSFYEWHVKNGKGYQVLLNEGKWTEGCRKLEIVSIF